MRLTERQKEILDMICEHTHEVLLSELACEFAWQCGKGQTLEDKLEDFFGDYSKFVDEDLSNWLDFKNYHEEEFAKFVLDQPHDTELDMIYEIAWETFFEVAIAEGFQPKSKKVLEYLAEYIQRRE